jgi:putative ubiquitin-RnfH superfamily antitoxin RatB of RatAB toxin-antitoxin module
VDSSDIQIEVVYALPEGTQSLQLRLPPGSTAGAALQRAVQAAQDGEFPSVNLESVTVGVFGRVVSREQPLKSGDRLELYRPLAADPKAARRKRVAGSLSE